MGPRAPRRGFLQHGVVRGPGHAYCDYTPGPARGGTREKLLRALRTVRAPPSRPTSPPGRVPAMQAGESAATGMATGCEQNLKSTEQR